MAIGTPIYETIFLAKEVCHEKKRKEGGDLLLWRDI